MNRLRAYFRTGEYMQALQSMANTIKNDVAAIARKAAEAHEHARNGNAEAAAQAFEEVAQQAAKLGKVAKVAACGTHAVADALARLKK